MSGLNQKTVGIKLRTLHIKFIRVHSTPGMGKLFAVIFVKIVDIGFYLHLLVSDLRVFLLLLCASVFETKFNNNSTVLCTNILLVDQVSEFFFKAKCHRIKSARVIKVIFNLILAVLKVIFTLKSARVLILY